MVRAGLGSGVAPIHPDKPARTPALPGKACKAISRSGWSPKPGQCPDRPRRRRRAPRGI